MRRAKEIRTFENLGTYCTVRFKYLTLTVYILYTKYFTDPCMSNPCEHAESCVQDLELGYRCKQCHPQYHGPKCEERKNVERQRDICIRELSGLERCLY